MRTPSHFLRPEIFSLLGLAVFLSCLLQPSLAFATGVVPAVLELTGSPGEHLEGIVTVVNDEIVSLTYQISFQDFISAGEDGSPQFLPENVTSGRSIGDWVTVRTPSVSLEPMERRDVTFSVDVPKTAESGSYYSALFFGSDLGAEMAGESFVNGRVGVLMFVDITSSGASSLAALSLEDFRADQTFTNALPILFFVRVRNQGQMILKPSGNIRIENVFGKTVKEISVNEDGGRVLPLSGRLYQTGWQKQEVPDTASAIVNEWKNFAFGRFVATLELSSALLDDPASASFVFWVIPWRLGLLAVSVLFFAVTIFKKHIKRKTEEISSVP
jgi:hypothetical protein